jgi:PAS domain S-box-containing protein
LKSFTKLAEGVDRMKVLETWIRFIEQRFAGSRCAVMVKDGAGAELRFAVAPSLPEEFLRGIEPLPVGPGSCSCGTAAYTGKTVLTVDLAQDPLWELRRTNALKFGLRACLSFPIVDLGGKVLGVLALYFLRPLQPDPCQVRLLEKYAIFAGQVLTSGREQFLPQSVLPAGRNTPFLGKLEKDMRLILEGSPCVILVVGKKGSIVYANGRIREYFGYEPGEVIGRGIEMLVPETLRAHHSQLREEFQQDPQQLSMGAGRDLKGLHKDGREVFVEVALTPLAGEQEMLTLATIMDITGRKTAEEALRRTLDDALVVYHQGGNYRLAAAVLMRGALQQTQSDAGLVAVFQDHRTLRLLANEGFQELPAFNGFQGEPQLSSENLHPALRSLVESGGPVRHSSDHPMALLTNKEAGTKFHNLLAVPIRNRGMVVGALVVAGRSGEYLEKHIADLENLCRTAGLLHDSLLHSERESVLQRELQESEARFRRLVENTNVIPFELDLANLRFTYVGPQAERLLGHSVQDWYRENFWEDHIHPEDRQTVIEMCRKRAGSVADFDLEYRMLAKDSNPVWFSNLFTVARQGPDACMLQGVLIDISQRKRREQEIRVLQSILSTASSAKSSQEALQSVLDILCRETGWSLGQAWIPDPAGQFLQICSSWSESPTVAERFRDANPSLRHSDDADLPGRVRIRRKILWVSDYSSDILYSRSPFAREAGLNTAVGVPVIADNEVLAVLEFFANSYRPEDGALGDLMSTACLEVGAVLKRKQAEDELKRAEERFRLLMHRNLAGVFRSTVDGRILECNQAFAEMLGYDSVEDVVATPATELYFPGKRSQFLLRLFEKGVLRGAELQLRRKDGSSAWVLESSTLIAEGEPLEASVIEGAVIDISERKRAVEALQDSEERYRAVVETATDGVLIVNESGAIDFANTTAEKILGFAPGQLNGKPLIALVPEPFRLRHQAAFRRYLETGEKTMQWHGLGFSGVKLNGELVPLEMSFGESVRGGKRLFTGIIRDISVRKKLEEDRKRLEEALRRSATEWQKTFDSMKSAILILDRDSRIIRLNQAALEMAGTSFDQILGMPLHAVSRTEPWNTTANMVPTLLVKGEILPVQAATLATGDTWDISLSFLDNGEEGARIIVIWTDITEVIKLQASLGRSETMSAMGRLVAGVSHEVRNPLFSISAILDAFESRFGIREEYSRHLAALRSELNRLTLLMQELLDYGKPISLDLKTVRIQDIVVNAVDSLSQFAERHQVKIVCSLPDSLPEVFADRMRMRQVFQNVLENAIQHSLPDSNVTVEGFLRQVDDQVWLQCAVSDSGPGIAPEDLVKIFEPFFSRRRGGTGLGLSIVQKILDQHGGSIVADNRSQGGAIMIISIPVSSLSAFR